MVLYFQSKNNFELNIKHKKSNGIRAMVYEIDEFWLIHFWHL